MPENSPLTCPACGKPLEITGEASQVTCPNCGASYLIQSSGEAVSLAPAPAPAPPTPRAAENPANDLAIKRLEDARKKLAYQRDRVLNDQAYRVDLHATLMRLIVVIGMIFFIAAWVFGSATSAMLGMIVACIATLAAMVVGLLVDLNGMRLRKKQQALLDELDKKIKPLAERLKRHEEVVSKP